MNRRVSITDVFLKNNLDTSLLGESDAVRPPSCYHSYFCGVKSNSESVKFDSEMVPAGSQLHPSENNSIRVKTTRISESKNLKLHGDESEPHGKESK